MNVRRSRLVRLPFANSWLRVFMYLLHVYAPLCGSLVVLLRWKSKLALGIHKLNVGFL